MKGSIVTKLKDILEGKYEVYFDMGSPGLMSKTVDAKNAKEAEKKVASGLKKGTYKIKKVVKEDDVKEGTCGYGVDGKLGEEPAGPHLLKKKKLLKSKKNESRNKSLGEKDLMNYLMKRFKFNRKKAIDTMKKAGFDTSMLKEFDLDEACQKGYMTHPTRKTKIMFGKRYRNCVKKEGVDSGKKRGYAKCVPASKAARMTDKQKASATRRKRAAQNKAGRGGKQSAGQGKKPIYVSTKPKK